MKKLLIIIFCGLAISATFFFIKKRELPAPPGPPSEIPREISLYHYFSGSLSGGINEMIETVNRRQDNKIVNAHALDHEAFKSMIHVTLDKGSPPELFTYWAGAKTQALVDANHLESFDDLWQEKELNKRFPRAVIEAASTYNGKKYLLPITQHLVVFFFNRKTFDQLGLGIPRTWPDFLRICKKIKTAGIIPIALGAHERWPAQFWFDYLLLRTAGPQYREALMNGKASYSDPEVLAAYRIWAELIERGYFNDDANNLDWAEATEMVCRGEAAITLMGTWAIQHFKAPPCSLQESVDFDFFTFPHIAEHVPYTSVGPIDGIVLARESSNHALAKTVLASFAENKAQQIMSRGSGGLAPSTEVPADFYTPFKRRLFEEISRSKHWAFNYDLATPPLVAEEGMDSFTELLAYPDQYRAILENLSTEAKKQFESNVFSADEQNRSK